MDFIFFTLFLFTPVSISKPTKTSINENCQLSKTGKQKDVVETLNTKYLSQEWLNKNADKLKRWFGTDKVKIVDGDMIITEKMEKLFMKTKLDRKAIKFPEMLWPEGIVPWDSEASIEDSFIKLALKHWEENTCLTFPKVDHKKFKGAYVHIINGNGCASEVGRDSLDGQPLILGSACATLGTIIHEFGHAIGFFHEHERPDRDEYVIMDERNVMKSGVDQFAITLNISSYGVPYDLTSIMHYSGQAYSKNGYFTLITRDPWKQFDIGHKDTLSFYDIKLANILYNCTNDHCNSKLKCKNEGFLDKNCKCRCPPNFKGKKCQNKIKLPKPSCYLYIKKQATSFSTPNYPNIYPKNAVCIYKIKAPKKKRVKLTFNTFDFAHNYFNYLDRVEIRSSKDVYEGIQYTKRQLENKSIISEGNVIWIFLITHSANYTGFEANVTFI